MEGLSSDLKLTHIIALGTGLAALLVALCIMVNFGTTTSPVTTADVLIACLGGITADVVVFLGANAALGGAYVNAVASLSGVSVQAGATPPAPAQQTTSQLLTLTPTQIQALATLADALNTKAAAKTTT